MRGLFSLAVTVILGYAIWDFFAPPILANLPSLSGSGVSTYLQGFGSPLRNLL